MGSICEGTFVQLLLTSNSYLFTDYHSESQQNWLSGQSQSQGHVDSGPQENGIWECPIQAESLINKGMFMFVCYGLRVSELAGTI